MPQREITAFNFQSYWVLMRLRKIISNIWKWGNESISRYYRKSVMETVTVQHCLLAVIKLHLFCHYRLQFSGYIMPLKNLLLSTQLSKPPTLPPKNCTDYFKSTQSDNCKNYSTVFSLNLFNFFCKPFTCNLRVIFGTKLYFETIVHAFYEATQYFL